MKETFPYGSEGGLSGRPLCPTRCGERIDNIKSGFYAEEVKVREVMRLIEDDGWFIVRTKGSHRQYHHPNRPGTVTISGHPGVDMPKGTLNSVLKQSGLKG